MTGDPLRRQSAKKSTILSRLDYIYRNR
jgi:hypothetical protein